MPTHPARSARTTLTLTTLALTLALSACGSSTTVTPGSTTGSTATASSQTSPTPSMSDHMTSPSADSKAMAAGSYLSLADYQSTMAQHSGTKVVYFFHAQWCPDCRATEKALLSSGVPHGLTVVKVDFDTETALRQKYGVTQQHTFVQVGTDGAALGKWTGSPDGAAILERTV